MKRTTAVFTMCSALLLASCQTSVNEQKVSALMQYEDSITTIISKMTLEEKVEMLHGKHMFTSAGVERLGIADVAYADGPFGIREEMEPHSWNPLGLATDSATFFPTGSALAATWDEETARRYGEGMALEARLRGKDMILGPAINLQRIPTGGRTYEYLSEDPMLSARLAVGYTVGAQENGAAVCLKHYALNNQENDRGSVDVKVSPRAMRELYLPPFEEAVKEGDAFGVMAAYNKVEGYWCSENEMLLNQILRKEWGFKGMVISDWGGVHSTVPAITAGMNVEMPGNQYLGQALLDSVNAGAVSTDIIDERVREILRVRLAIPAVPESEANRIVTSQPRQQKIAYEVASRSIVLLKNDGGLLPINTGNVKTIAVIGDNAVRTQALGGVGAGVKALYEITPLQGLTDRLQGSGIELKWAQGYTQYTKADREKHVSPYEIAADSKLMAEAVALAAKSDLVIFVGGDNREIETEGSDREQMLLPVGQNELLNAIAQVNKNIVSIFVSGGPLDLRQAEKVSSAMIMSWFNGSEGGNALADVLTGKLSPSGKLPFTLPLALEDSPAYALGVYPQQRAGEDVFVNLVDRKQRTEGAGPVAPYKEDILVGYRWFDTKNKATLYPFGHGLSYTTFAYSDLKAEMAGDNLHVSFTLTNSGQRDADEVAQVYIGRPDSKIERPVKELKAFKRIALKAGASQTVTFDIPKQRLCHWDESQNGWSYEEGAIDVFAGGSSAGNALTKATAAL